VSARFLKLDPELEVECRVKFLRVKTYDPSIGRFLQVDPDPGKLTDSLTVINKFAYVGSSPIFMTDPTGRFWNVLATAIASVASSAAILGAGIGFAVSFGSALNGKASFGDALNAGLIGAATGALTVGLTLILTPVLGPIAAGAIASTAGGALNGYLMAKKFGGDPGQAALIGAAGGLVGFTFSLGVANIFFGVGATTAAANAIALPFGIWGGSSINSGIGPKPESDKLVPQQ